MKTISVHGIDKEIEKAIRERAKTEGRSVNRIVKGLIAESLGLGEHKGVRDRRRDFADLHGIWTREEADDFLEAIGDLETVDPKDWR